MKCQLPSAPPLPLLLHSLHLMALPPACHRLRRGLPSAQGMQSISQHKSIPMSWGLAGHLLYLLLCPGIWARVGQWGWKATVQRTRGSAISPQGFPAHSSGETPPPRPVQTDLVLRPSVPEYGYSKYLCGHLQVRQASFSMKSSHAYSKPTVTSVPPGLLSTIIFSYFIFQVDEKFPMAVVVLYLFSVHLFFSNHIIIR